MPAKRRTQAKEARPARNTRRKAKTARKSAGGGREIDSRDHLVGKRTPEDQDLDALERQVRAEVRDEETCREALDVIREAREARAYKRKLHDEIDTKERGIGDVFPHAEGKVREALWEALNALREQRGALEASDGRRFARAGALYRSLVEKALLAYNVESRDPRQTATPALKRQAKADREARKPRLLAFAQAVHELLIKRAHGRLPRLRALYAAMRAAFEATLNDPRRVLNDPLRDLYDDACEDGKLSVPSVERLRRLLPKYRLKEAGLHFSAQQ